MTTYAVAPLTALHENVTGEVRFVAPSAGAMIFGESGAVGQPAAVVMNLLCADSVEQLSDPAMTYHSTDVPAATVVVNSVSRLTCSVANAPPLNDARRR